MTIADQSVDRPSMEAALQTLLATGRSRVGQLGNLLALKKKLASNQLHLAVLGQMKRGKSSFINALLGAEVLPTGVLPVTSVITEIKYGPGPGAATIGFAKGLREQIELCALAEYVTEAGNPGNRRQVTSVEITYSSAFLGDGMTLIDTPGIGSTHAHNTRTTERYLQHVDVGIVVLSVDPPITEVESQFIRNLQIAIPKLLFVLNKIDIVSQEEIFHISRFTEHELCRLRIESPEIFPVSARQALFWKQGSTTADSSGIECFEKRLQRFLVEEKSRTLLQSVAMDALTAARTLRFAAAIGARAQRMSPDELSRKQMALDESLEKTEIEMHELKVLLRQHSSDLISRIERDLKAHVQASTPTVRKNLQSFQLLHPKESGHTFGTLLENFLMQEVESIFRDWRIQEDEEIQKQLNILSSRLVASTNTVLERLQHSAGSLFGVPIEHLDIRCPLHMESHLYYKVDRVFDSLDSFLLVLPRFLLRPLIMRRMCDDIGRLLDINAGRIRYDFLERVQTSVSRFEKELTNAIGVVSESLRRSLRKPVNEADQTVAVLDSLIEDCSQFLE